MSEIEEAARAFWRAARRVRLSKPDSIMRHLALGELLVVRTRSYQPKIASRLADLVSQHQSEITASRGQS